MPHQDPDFADIYGVGVHVIPDAHNAPRRNVVVYPMSDYVIMLGRTSDRSEFKEASCLLSEVDNDCQLDRPGMFSERFKHSVPRHHFSNERDCEYYGTLKTDESERLRAFWDRLWAF